MSASEGRKATPEHRFPTCVSCERVYDREEGHICAKVVRDPVQAAVALLTKHGYTVRPPCVECDEKHPCRLVYLDADPGLCALSATSREGRA